MFTQKKILRAIAPLCFILFIDAISFGFILPELGPLFFQDKQFLPETVSSTVRHLLYSITISLPLFFMFIGGPLIGGISDFIGRKKTLLLSLLGISFCCILSGVGIAIGSIVLFLIGRALLGLLNSNESIAQAAIADLSRGSDNIAINMSFVTLAGTVGFIIGPLLGGYFSDQTNIHWFNYQTPFYVAAGLSIVSAIMLLCLFEETYKPAGPAKIDWKKSLDGLTLAIFDKRFHRLASLYFFMEMGWGIYFQSISLYLLTTQQFTTRQNGAFLTFIAVCFTITLAVIMPWFHRRFAAETTVKVGMVLMALGAFMTVAGHGALIAWVAVVPATVGVGLSYNNLLALISNAAHTDEQGKTMGMTVSIVAIAWILAAFLSGLLSDVDANLPFILMGVFGVLGVLLNINKKAVEVTA